MELFRGYNSRHAPDKTGQVRLCKATFFRDVDVANPGNRDEKEGETRILTEGTVTREDDGGFGLGETTLTIEEDGEVTGVAHLERGSKGTTFKKELRTEVHPVPYIFCAARKPETSDEERRLKEFLSKDRDYDAWYTIKDAEALGRELEKAVNGWLFDRRVRVHKLYRRYGWVSYYPGKKPDVVADMTDDRWGDDVADHLASMNAWFSKRQEYSEEMEYRYAYVLESPELSTLPECIDLDLTMAAIKLFERS